MPEPPDDPLVIQQGAAARFTCRGCMTEFELTPEPKMKGKAMEGDTYTVHGCPLCGGPAGHLDRDD